MESKNFSLKKLYSILRYSIFNTADVSTFSSLLDIYFNKDEIKYDEFLLTIFNISPQEYKNLMSFESDSGNLTTEHMYYTIKRVISKLHNNQIMVNMKNDVESFKIQHPKSKYFTHSFILNLFEINKLEFNRIMHYEITLSNLGIKDNGLTELHADTQELIDTFLIKDIHDRDLIL